MLKQQIQSDVTSALKEGNQEITGVLRLVLSSIGSKEKEKRYALSKKEPNLKEEDLVKKSELTDEEVMSILSSEIKKRKDAIELYQKGDRPELADKEKKEIQIIKKYLPEQLPLEELRKLVEESINKIMKDPSSPTNSSGQVMGKVMADLMPKVKGRADNSEISKIIKELLNK